MNEEIEKIKSERDFAINLAIELAQQVTCKITDKH